MRLTPKQHEVLAAVADSRVSGVCIRYSWIYRCGPDVVTPQVAALIKKGLVDMMAFSGGIAAINLTDAGRDAITNDPR